MSKEKFVRSKPHVALAVAVIAFFIALAATIAFPTSIPPGNLLLIQPATSSASTARIIRPNIGGVMVVAFFNGIVYGTVTGILSRVVIKGKKILEN